MLIPHARGIAEQVAKLITNFSYRYRTGGVKEILLFGSTLRGEANDIDLAIIHTLPYLRELGIFTKYDVKAGRNLPDLEAKIEEHRYRAEAILELLGSPEYPSKLDLEWDVRQEIRKQLRPSVGWYDEEYGGTVELPFIGEITFRPTSSYHDVLTQTDEVMKTLRSRLVLEKVNALLEEKNLPVNKTLDLHLLDEEVLLPGYGQERREILLRQCRDPTFWYTVFTSGKLYDQSSGTFSISFQEKYDPELFIQLNPFDLSKTHPGSGELEIN